MSNLVKFTELNIEIIDAYEIVEQITEIQIEKKKGNYNQAGKNNNNYKNGISTYHQYKKSRCESCGSTKNLMVHHIDGNRKNNEKSNLKTLCWSCHERVTRRK